jgi:D-alanyl-D-alanine carboxypeptidase/D-alanyl-D-alanine-endopeptidase (penicillin-binding protein 4)
MRRFLLLLCLVFTFHFGYSKRPVYKKHHVVNKTLAEILRDKDFKPAEFGFFAIDGNTGEIIAMYNPDKALRPASNLKLLTTATALDLYGPDYQFKTYVAYTGKIDTVHHILHGNIVIKGGGDPTLGSKYFDETKTHQFLYQWVRAVKALGIDSVDGRVVADAGIFSRDIVPVSWSWTNTGTYYGAGASGISIYDNYYTLYLDTDSVPGDSARIDSIVPQVPGLVFDNGITADTVSSDESNILGGMYCNRRYLRGKLPLCEKGIPEKGSLPDPAWFAAYELSRVLNEHGIKQTKDPTTVRRLQNTGLALTQPMHFIDSTYSPTLADIVKKTNTYSINLFAEHMLDLCGLKLIGIAQTEQDAKAVTNYWSKKGLDTQGINLTDGSGLSQYDAITPRQIVSILHYMKQQDSTVSEVYFHSLPLAGSSEGTLEGMFKGSVADSNLRAKSGTIDKVKAYSGYVTSRSGRKIIFSMMVNNFSCKSREARSKLEKLMISLAALKK